MKIRSNCLALAVLFAPVLWAEEAAAPKRDARYPFRTDSANADLPWYKPRNGEFPPHHSDHRVSGELVAVDFIHRSGQFRVNKTGELVDFTMPPYAWAGYLNAEADLRDVPLGTDFLFFLNQDTRGEFTRLATMQEQFTMDASHGSTYRLDEARLSEGKLLTTKHSLPKNLPDLGKRELQVRPETRVWKGGAPAKLTDLAAGDELLFNLTGKTADSPGWCTDIWAGVDEQTRATEQQRQRFAENVKRRGMPAWIERTEGNKMSVVLFSGDARNFEKTFLPSFIVGKDVPVVVANDELRTWNPPVDKERATVNEVQRYAQEAYGAAGVRVTMTLPNMLEGFRRGHVVRIFASAWPLKDQPYGESLMGYGYTNLRTSDLVENPAKEYPGQFPFATDFGNEWLPWFQLKEDAAPPAYAEHVVTGEIVSTNASSRSGQFRADRTAQLVDFTLTKLGTVKYRNAKASLADLPAGLRCRFSLFQDEKGAFTRATLVSDEFSYMAANYYSYRVEAVNLAEGKLHVARQLVEVKNYNGDMETPPDVGRAELRFSTETRVWKTGGVQASVSDLVAGEAIFVNLSGELPGAPSRCLDIWVGADAPKWITAEPARKLAEAGK